MIQRVKNHLPVPLPIGIVGGMGPYAGFDLVRKIFRWTDAGSDEEHLPVMLHSFPGWIPVRPGFLMGQTKENPGEDIGEVMVGLARCGAKVIGMPCNTAHSPRILDTALEILGKSGSDVRFVSIIESTASLVARLLPQGGKIGLMGTIATLRSHMYQDALEKNGFETVTPDEEECVRVQQATHSPEFGIKAFSDPVTEQSRMILLEAARRMAEEKKVEAIILGCTEIPLAITETALYGVPVVDATSALARALISASCPERLRKG